MLLAIDIGNSTIKFAVFTDDVQTALWRCTTKTKRTVDEYVVFLSGCARDAGLDFRYVTKAILSSVVPEITPLVEQACQQVLAFDPLIVGKTVALPVKCLVDNPAATGVDRLVAIMAVRQVHKLPALIIDFGTATTFTLIDADGNYCGGAIAPGVDLSLQALASAAAQLPKIELQAPAQVVGLNTINSMQSGIYYGTLAMVEGMIIRLAAEFGAFSSVIASGGICPVFKDRIDGVTTYDPHLNLTGLRYIHESFSNDREYE